ncbi:MAG: hypothetical protein IT518_11915 [Burkholderiales bacterium]|nr:hypothetical protein [Burkholderiales bacterium]
MIRAPNAPIATGQTMNTRGMTWQVPSLRLDDEVRRTLISYLVGSNPPPIAQINKRVSLLRKAWLPYWAREAPPSVLGKAREAWPALGMVYETEVWLGRYFEDVRIGILAEARVALLRAHPDEDRRGRPRNEALERLIFELRRIFWRYCFVERKEDRMRRVRGAKSMLSILEVREEDFVTDALEALRRAVQALGPLDDVERRTAMERRRDKALKELAVVLDSRNVRYYFDRSGVAMPSAERYGQGPSGKWAGKMKPLHAMKGVTKSHALRARDDDDTWEAMVARIQHSEYMLVDTSAVIPGAHVDRMIRDAMQSKAPGLHASLAASNRLDMEVQFRVAEFEEMTGAAVDRAIAVVKEALSNDLGERSHRAQQEIGAAVESALAIALEFPPETGGP